METLAEYYTKRKCVFLKKKNVNVFMKVSLILAIAIYENYMKFLFEYKYDEKLFYGV